MTRAEQVKFCTKCLNREMDIQQGVLCKLTGAKAAFDTACRDFARDETVQEREFNPEDPRTGDVQVLTAKELKEELHPEIFNHLKMEQNLPAGIVAGLVSGVLGAGLWCGITLVTGWQFSFFAVLIGGWIGLAVSFFGKGIDRIFGFWGGGIALLSIVLGNFLSIIGYVAHAESLGFFEVLSRFDYRYLPALMKETFSVYDALFYLLAVVEGYKFSFRTINSKTVASAKAKLAETRRGKDLFL